MKSVLKSISLGSLCFVLFCAMSFIHLEKEAPSDSYMDDLGGAYLTFNGKFGGDLTNEDIANTTSLEVAGCAEGSRITQFTLVVLKAGSSKTYSGDSPDLTADMKNSLKHLKKGDSFEFKKVKAKLPKGGMVDVYCKKFTIV